MGNESCPMLPFQQQNCYTSRALEELQNQFKLEENENFCADIQSIILSFTLDAFTLNERLSISECSASPIVPSKTKSLCCELLLRKNWEICYPNQHPHPPYLIFKLGKKEDCTVSLSRTVDRCRWEEQIKYIVHITHIFPYRCNFVSNEKACKFFTVVK